MNQAAINLIATTLPHGLPHPGNNNRPPSIVPLPGFRATGMSDKQADEMIGQSSTLVAEALINLLETEFELIPKNTAAQLRQDAADAPDGTRIINIRTTPTSPPVLQLTIGKTDDVIVPAAALRAMKDA